MANQFLSLALFLMLLSFFIVMNALSDYEKSKAISVINSISLAFSSEVSNNNRAPVAELSRAAAVGEGDALGELEGLFNTHMAGFEVSRNRLGTVMHVQTSIGKFENAIDVMGVNYNDADLGDKGSFLKTMVTLLISKKKGIPYRMDMVVNISDDPTILKQQNLDEFMRSLKQVSEFASTLERAGLPKKMISAGLAKGQSGVIDLYFYRYKAIKLPSDIGKME